MSTPEQKREAKRIAMAKYRQKLKEQDLEGYLKKQRESKQKLRLKAKEQKEILPDKNQVVLTLPKPKPKPKEIKPEIIKVKDLPKVSMENTKKINIDIVKHKEIKQIEKIEKPKTKKNKVIKEPKNLRKSKKSKVEIDENILPADLVTKLDTTNLINTSKNINENTLKKYLSNIRILYERMFNEPFNNDIKFLHDKDAVSNYINTNFKEISTKTNYFKSIVGILKRLKGYTNISKYYSKMMMINKKAYEEIKSTNELTKNEKLNYVNWEDIKNMPTDKLNAYHKLLFALSVYLPPRRLEYKSLRLIRDTDILEDDKNYLIVDKNNNALSIVYNVYKTSKDYGTYEIDLTQKDIEPYIYFSKVRNALKEFLNTYNIKDNQLIFGQGLTIKEYTDFTRVLNKTFKYFAPKKISVNILRHSYLTWVYSHKTLSVKMMKLLAEYMGHSVLEALRYRKFENNDEKKLLEKQLKENK